MDTLLIDGHEVRRENGRQLRPEARLGSLPIFKTVRGWAGDWDDSGTLLIGDAVIKSEWPVRLAITVEKVWVKTWQVSLHAVAPTAPDSAILDVAVDMSNLFPDELGEKDRAQARIEALVNFGATATLTYFFSENARAAVLAAQAEAIGVAANFNLYMDCPVNVLGATGWDMIRGLTKKSGEPCR